MEKENIQDTITNILTNIKELRTSKNLSMQNVADGIGASQQVYDRIEKGITELTISRMIHLAEFYGVTVNEVLFGIGKTSKGATEALKKQIEAYKDKLLVSQQEVIKLQREQTYKGL